MPDYNNQSPVERDSEILRPTGNDRDDLPQWAPEKARLYVCGFTQIRRWDDDDRIDNELGYVQFIRHDIHDEALAKVEYLQREVAQLASESIRREQILAHMEATIKALGDPLIRAQMHMPPGPLIIGLTPDPVDSGAGGGDA